MIKSSTSLVLLSVLLATGGPSAVAQQAPSGTEIATLTAEIGKLNGSLDDIARSLRVLLHDQKIQVVIRRIELAERRQAPFSSELRSARADVRAQKEELVRMEGIMENIRRRVDDAIRQGNDPQNVPERAELEQFESMLEIERERLSTAEVRVIDLENDAARGRDRIGILDEQLQELLDASE